MRRDENLESMRLRRFYLIGNLGALVGGIVAAALLDKIGRKITVPSFYALAALGVLLLAAATYTRDWRAVLIAFTLANLFATGAGTFCSTRSCIRH